MPIRVGIIGTGFGASVHAPVLKEHPAYDLVAIASMRPGKAGLTAANLGIEKAYNDWRQMVLEDELDLVVIATKPGLHAEMVELALTTSHHVLCEKPPALSVSETETMAKIAHVSGKIAAMNFEWRYLPERLAVRSILDTGTIGEIFHVNWSEVWPLWPQLQDSEASWEWLAEEGGGMLGAIGSHIIDTLCHWFGPFTTIQGQTINHVPKRRQGEDWVTTTAEDSFSFIGRFERGTTCSVSCTVAAVGRRPEVEIVGTKGTMKIEGHDLTLATLESHALQPVQVQSPMDASAFPKEIQGYIHAQWRLYDDLALSIADQHRPNLPTLEDAVLVQAAMDSIRPTFLKLQQMIERE